jgi:hypothetical protein
MQQLDGKWSQWWRQSSDMCDKLQHQMSLLCSQQEVTTQRMQQLEGQVHLPHSMSTFASSFSTMSTLFSASSTVSFVTACASRNACLPPSVTSLFAFKT